MNELETAVQQKLEADEEFQNTIKDLPDEEKSPLIETRKKELLDAEIKDLREKSEKISKLEETSNNYKTRAEKAEQEAKKYKAEKKPDEEVKMSTKDFYALTNAKVPEEDVDDVTEFAKFKGISISEALKSPIVKATLAEKVESRKTAQASQIRSTRPQNVKPDGYSVLEEAKKKGEEGIPEPGSESAEAMFWARRGRKPV